MDYEIILETINSLIQIGVLVVAFKALDQINVAKRGTDISAQISVAQYTGQLIKDFYKDTEPLINELGDFYGKIGYKVHKGEIKLKQFTLGEINESELSDHFKYSVKTVFASPEGRNKVTRVTNGFEVLASSCIKGIADDEVAFSSIGQLFCNNVEELYFTYCLLRRDEKEEYDFYKNTIDLYIIWSTRIKKHSLLSEQKEIEKNIELLREKKIKKIGND